MESSILLGSRRVLNTDLRQVLIAGRQIRTCYSVSVMTAHLRDLHHICRRFDALGLSLRCFQNPPKPQTASGSCHWASSSTSVSQESPLAPLFTRYNARVPVRASPRLRQPAGGPFSGPRQPYEGRTELVCVSECPSVGSHEQLGCRVFFFSLGSWPMWPMCITGKLRVNLITTACNKKTLVLLKGYPHCR